MFRKNPVALAVLTALRHPRQSDIAQKDVAFLKSLKPHLTRALLLHGKMMDIQQAGTAAGHVLDSIDVALLGLSSEGKTCFTNELADSILRSEEILSLENDRVVVHDSRAVAACQKS